MNTIKKESFFKKILFMPSRNTASVIPIVLIVGFITGLILDTSGLKNFILPVTVLMIYPTMIGFKLNEVFNLSHGKLLLTSEFINFIIIPLIAYILGKTFLMNNPQFFAGLIITSLLPTSNLTIAFTMLAKGNVPGAVKLTTIGLILGSLLTPVYLSALIGKYLPVDILGTLVTISQVILIPLILGILSYKFLLKKYSAEEFQKNIKPYLPAVSSWGMVFIVFSSISMNASRIASHLDVFAVALLVQVSFFFINYIISAFVGGVLFKPQDAIAFVFGTALRNLAIAMGLAATAFGPNAALMVSLAFIIQPQAAAWFVKLNEKYKFFYKNATV
ncbi:MAG: bile acid:sodium symporter [Clostridium sp.]|uniref:arsenic resistance protein n=1 Tax=Clostridium sp. TaxID=1506 RepID=UPI0025C30168|nr:bile acid:sodium symporter [Clostridium sp.]MCE5219769.1 bile acid:sodium symporter [Clostridium sp.]